MPPGNLRINAPAKVIEKATAEACITIARRIQRAHQGQGDAAGTEAARQVADSIQQELLGDFGSGSEGLRKISHRHR